MSRRALTQLLAIVLAVGLAVAGGAHRVPYVALLPGPAYDTLGTVGGTPVLAISGHKTYPTDGTLDLTTVSVKDRISLFEALVGWFSPRQAVIPREIVFPPDKTEEENDAENQQQMQQSQDDATTAALRELGIPAMIRVVVQQVAKGGPSQDHLLVGDVLTTIDGKKVTDSASLRRLISARAPGRTVVVGYTRKGKAATVTLTTGVSTDTPMRAIIGISPQEMASFPVKVDIELKDVGGPSAGLMFALGIIDKLGPESLTGGRSIAGTGEITSEGKVGPIGGIAQKMLGAKDRGAKVFLVPADNCPDAKGSRPDGLQLIRVETLKGALASLKTLRSGGTPQGC